MILRTARLDLRQWSDADRAPFADLNADPEVMEHYPRPLTRDESDQLLDRLAARIREQGFGLWAAGRRSDGQLLGFVGLQHVPFEEHYTPAIELGWRLRRDAWGFGYATEAARACADYAFAELGVRELFAMARPANEPSRRVMSRLGMTHDPADDFRYPPAGQPGSLDYVLYRLARPRPGSGPAR
jgi:ribosomal-protein-alanine N-acetyltransferase